MHDHSDGVTGAGQVVTVTQGRDRSTGVDLDALGRIGLALASDIRRRILVTLIDGAAHPTDLAERLQTSRANVSNHLACLRGCGLVRVTPAGRRMRYELADPRLADALRQLSGLLLTADPAHLHLPPEG